MRERLEKNMKKIQVWAHRGASGYAPENTLPAFQEAIDQGADGIELDIQLSKDGELVVIHDEKIDRTSSGKGWVKDYTLEELKAFDYNYQNVSAPGQVIYPEYEKVEIPTMKEVLDLLAPTNLCINIELKTGIVFYPKIEEKILDLVKSYHMEDRVIYSSFNHATILRIKELNPSAKTGFLYADGTLEMPSYGARYGVDALHPALYNLQYPGFLEQCREKGLKIHVWTVNEPEYVRMCIGAQVDAVITNVPDMVRAMIEQE